MHVPYCITIGNTSRKIIRASSGCFACSPAAQIGRQLAVIGDDINRRYDTTFNHMIYLMNLTPETAYEAFAGVARK